jgi:hypothetical protein
MGRPIIYRTYLVKLWLSTMLVSPFSFLLIAFIINSSAFTNVFEGPIGFAVELIFLMILVIPTFLFLILLSVIVPKFTEDPNKLKKITITASVAGTLITFISFYDPEYHSKTQLLWGLFLTLTYCASVIYFGTLFHVQDQIPDSKQD